MTLKEAKKMTLKEKKMMLKEEKKLMISKAKIKNDVSIDGKNNSV